MSDTPKQMHNVVRLNKNENRECLNEDKNPFTVSAVEQTRKLTQSNLVSNSRRICNSIPFE